MSTPAGWGQIAVGGREQELIFRRLRAGVRRLFLTGVSVVPTSTRPCRDQENHQPAVRRRLAFQQRTCRRESDRERHQMGPLWLGTRSAA